MDYAEKIQPSTYNYILHKDKSLKNNIFKHYGIGVEI